MLVPLEEVERKGTGSSRDRINRHSEKNHSSTRLVAFYCVNFKILISLFE